MDCFSHGQHHQLGQNIDHRCLWCPRLTDLPNLSSTWVNYHCHSCSWCFVLRADWDGRPICRLERCLFFESSIKPITAKLLAILFDPTLRIAKSHWLFEFLISLAVFNKTILFCNFFLSNLNTLGFFCLLQISFLDIFKSF